MAESGGIRGVLGPCIFSRPGHRAYTQAKALPETGLELPGGGFRAYPLWGQIFLNPNQLWDGFFATKRKNGACLNYLLAF